MLWALGELRVQPARVMPFLLGSTERFRRRAPAIAAGAPHHLVLALASWARMRHRPGPEAVEAALAALRGQLLRCTGRDLADLLWALARLGEWVQLRRDRRMACSRPTACPCVAGRVRNCGLSMRLLRCLHL